MDVPSGFHSNVGYPLIAEMDPMISTRERVRVLVESGKFGMTTEIAKVVGISRERVRQIIRDDKLHWIPIRGRLKWDCPDCGTPISIRRSAKKLKYWPAHCNACRIDLLKKFYRVCGHPKIPENTIGTTCKICANARAKCIVEIRTCMACGEPLELSRGGKAQIRNSKSQGLFHWKCYSRLPKDMIHPKQSNCKRGHPLSGDNLYHWEGKRICKGCASIRRKKSYLKKKREYII